MIYGKLEGIPIPASSFTVRSPTRWAIVTCGTFNYDA